MSDLSGKVALVTGGSRGIGAEIARTLTRNGAAVAFTYHSAADRAQALEKEIQADGGRALAIQADNADGQAVRAAHMTDGGRIINIGSCLIERLPGPGMTLYAMSKSALKGLTKGLARDLGPRGITAVVVDPGPTDTDMNPAEGPAADYLRGFIAVGHYGHAQDVASMVAYLAGPGGRHVSGSSVLVDGGFAA